VRLVPIQRSRSDSHDTRMRGRGQLLRVPRVLQPARAVYVPEGRCRLRSARTTADHLHARERGPPMRSSRPSTRSRMATGAPVALWRRPCFGTKTSSVIPPRLSRPVCCGTSSYSSAPLARSGRGTRSPSCAASHPLRGLRPPAAVDSSMISPACWSNFWGPLQARGFMFPGGWTTEAEGVAWSAEGEDLFHRLQQVLWSDFTIEAAFRRMA
jgi:hypothetical protein